MSVYLGYNEVTKQYLKSLTGGGSGSSSGGSGSSGLSLLGSRCLEISIWSGTR